MRIVPQEMSFPTMSDTAKVGWIPISLFANLATEYRASCILERQGLLKLLYMERLIEMFISHFKFLIVK